MSRTSQAEKPRQSLTSSAALAPVIVLFLGAIFIAGILVFFGGIGWPGLHWDAAYYGTPVLNVANNKGWIFGSYGPYIVSRPDLAFDDHGLLHVILYGSILKAKTWNEYLWAQGVINGFSYAIYLALFLVHLSRVQGLRWRSVVSALLLASVPASICIGFQGRPEQLAPLILTLPLCVVLFSQNRLHTLLAMGACLGLLTTLSPLTGFLFATFLIGYFYVRNQGHFRSSIRDYLLCLIVGILVAASVITFFTPFSATGWIANIGAAKEGAINHEGSLSRFSQGFWGNSTNLPAWNIAVIACVAFGLRTIWRVGRHRILILLIITAPLLLINQKGIDYTMMPFLPFAIGLYLQQSPNSWQRNWEKPWQIGTAQTLILAFSCFYLATILSQFLISLNPANGQASLRLLQHDFALSQEGQALKQPGIAVAYPAVVSPSLVVLGDGGIKLVAMDAGMYKFDQQPLLRDYEAATGNKVMYYLLPQNYIDRYSSPPQSIFVGPQEFELKSSNWLSQPNNLISRVLQRLTTFSSRYDYAVYTRK